MSKNNKSGDVFIVKGNTAEIIRNADAKIAAREEKPAWLNAWNERLDKSSVQNDPAYYHNRCGEWRNLWRAFVKRKLEYLDAQIENRISKFGANDWMARSVRERRMSFLQFVNATNEVARGMSALAEEMFLQARMREAKQEEIRRFCDITTAF